MLGIRNRLQNAEHELKQLNILLKANHPERILQQGYSMLEDQDGRVISDISQLQISGSGQDHPAVYHLIMKNGRAEITVVSKEDRKSESAGRSR